MIRIITDSAADLEPQDYHRLNVPCIPLTVVFGQQEYLENETLSKDEFYAMLSQGNYPKTSQPSPVLLAQLLEQARDDGDDAIYICISSAISGTYQTACMTCEDVGHGHVFDGRIATGGQRLLVREAVRMRDAGATAAQILEALHDLRERITLYACMDTLEYLYRGGRISQTVYKLGSMAQIKPIIHFTREGFVEVPGKAMGMRKGMDMLRKKLEQQPHDPEYPLYVMYTGNRSVGEALADKFRAEGIHIPAHRIINVGAAIGTHIGPNACGIVYVAKK